MSVAHADTVVEPPKGQAERALLEVVDVRSKHDYLKFLSEHRDAETFDLTVISNPNVEDVFLLGSLGCKLIRSGLNSCNSEGGCTELAASKQVVGSRAEILNSLDEMLDFIEFSTRTSCAQWAEFDDSE